MAGRSSGSVTSRKRPPARRPQGAGRLLQAGIEVAPQPADGAHHHGHVEEGVGDEDQPDRPLQVDPERAAGAEQGQEGRAHHHGGQHERHEQQGPQHPLAREVELGEQRGHGQGHDQRDHGRDRRLPHA